MMGAKQTVEVNQSKPSPVTLTGYSKAEQVSGDKGEDYSIIAHVTFQDESEETFRIEFSTGTHDWNPKVWNLNQRKRFVKLCWRFASIRQEWLGWTMCH